MKKIIFGLLLAGIATQVSAVSLKKMHALNFSQTNIELENRKDDRIYNQILNEDRPRLINDQSLLDRNDRGSHSNSITVTLGDK